MRTSRRVAFAVPFVVTVACEKPVEVREPTPEIETRDESPRPDARPPVPSELVDEMMPLRARPAPSVTPTDRMPDRVEPVTLPIVEIQRGVVNTRIHVRRAPRADDSWRIVIVDRDKVAKGECTIVEWDSRMIECTTSLTPEQLLVHGETLQALLVPPPALVAEVDATRARLENMPPRCCVNPPRPPPRPPEGETVNPPPPMRARVINVAIAGASTLVTAAKGSAQGVGKDWNALLVDESDKPVAGGACVIVRVTERVVTCAVKLTPDQVKQFPFLRLSPAH